jgi:hypothetical protein
MPRERDILLKFVRSGYKIPPDVVDVILVLHKKERRHLPHETIMYIFLFPTDFAKFLVG